MLLNQLYRPRFLYEGDSGGTGGGSTDTNPDKKDPPAGGSGDGAGGGESTRTFKQSELDALFAERAKQGGQSAIDKLLKELGVEDAEALRATIKAANEAKAAQMSELEKAQQAIKEAETARQKAEAEKAEALVLAGEKLLRAAVLAEASKQGFNDPGDAWLYLDRAAIKAKDDDAYEGLDKAVEAVAKAKPYLLKAQQSGDGKGTPRREKFKPDKTVQGQDEPRRPIVRL